MYHKLFLSLSAILFTVICTITTHAVNTISIAAVVNDKVITHKDLDDRLSLTLLGAQRQPTPEERTALKQKIVRQMVEEILQLQETKMFDIDAEEEEIAHHLTEVEKNNGLAPGELEKKLSEAGIPKQTLIDQTRANIAWAKFVMQLRSMAKVGKKVVHNHAMQKQHRDQTRYLLAEIVLPFTSRGAEMQVSQMAQQLAQEIQMGKPFSAAAMELSQSPSAALGGDIDWVDEDQLAPNVLETLREMPIGSLSQPIRTEDSYRIVLLRGKHDAGRSNQKISMRQIDVTFPLMMTKTEKENEVKRAMAILQGVTDCKGFEQAAEKITGATLQVHHDINPDQLSGGLDKVLENMPLNMVSEPLPIEDTSVMFFMVCDRKAVEKDVLMDEKKQEIEQQLAQKRLASIATSRLKNMHRRAYIDVRI